MKTLNDYKEEYNKLKVKKNLKGKEALEAVRRNGYDLRYVIEQTPEICLEAVKRNGYALEYVNEQTPEICLEAVRQNVDALQFVNENMFSEDTEIIALNGKRYKLIK